MSLKDMNEKELSVLKTRFSKIVKAIEEHRVAGMVMVAEVIGEEGHIEPELILFGEQSSAALARQVGLLEHTKLQILSHLQAMTNGSIKGGLSRGDFADNVKNPAH
jgi:hypothetical protein